MLSPKQKKLACAAVQVCWAVKIWAHKNERQKNVFSQNDMKANWQNEIQKCSFPWCCLNSIDNSNCSKLIVVWLMTILLCCLFNEICNKGFFNGHKLPFTHLFGLMANESITFCPNEHDSWMRTCHCLHWPCRSLKKVALLLYILSLSWVSYFVVECSPDLPRTGSRAGNTLKEKLTKWQSFF